MNETILENANKKADEQGLSSFKRGYKYHEAFIYWSVKKFPNDKKLGEYIRKTTLTHCKDNPYNEYVKSIAKKIYEMFKKE
jgi:hypothetical protein